MVAKITKARSIPVIPGWLWVCSDGIYINQGGTCIATREEYSRIPEKTAREILRRLRGEGGGSSNKADDLARTLYDCFAELAA